MRFIDAPFYARQMIVVSFILTFVLAIIGLFTSVRLCKRHRYLVLPAVTFALSFLSVFLTMCGSYLYRVGKSVFEPSLTIISLPLWLHCVVAVVLLALAVYGLVSAVLWNKKHISPVSIKESADSLPAGICFYEQSGLVRLINTEMNQLCVLASGKALLDGASFWRKISQGEIEENCLPLQTGEKPIIEYEGGKVVSFKRYQHEIDDKTVYEIVATNVTERYRLTKELEQKLDELKAVNKRLVAYGDNVALLTKEKELLAAKIRIHDDMGKLLLATKRRLAEPLNETEQKQMICFWQAEIAALKSTRPRTKKDNLQVIKDAAKLVGVTVEFRGEKPKADTVNEKILIAAMHECLTNTVSHANGKTMTVTVSDKNGKYTIEITNDGEKPKGEIIEGGGVRLVTSVVKGLTAKVRLVFGESVSEAMSDIGYKNATNHHSPRDFDALISNLSALEFGNTGFRFLRIVLLGNDAEIAFKNVIGVCSLPCCDRKGFIKTSDERLNKIIETAVYTCTLNMQDGFLLDGIKRDRLVWSGDLFSEIKTVFYTFGETEHIRNSLDLLIEGTPEDIWMNLIPSYDAWWILNFCEYLRFTGDTEYGAKYVGKVADVLREFDKCVSEDGVIDFSLSRKKHGMHEFFFDWQSEGTEDSVTGTALLIYYAAETFIKTFGKAADGEVTRSLLRKLNRYVYADAVTKQVAALQVLCGNRSSDKISEIENGGARGFSTFTAYFILKALSVGGSKKAVNFAKEYYGGMLDRGATSFWEDFNVEWLEGSGRIDELPKDGEKDLHGDFGNYCYKGFRHSLCHGWASGILPFVYEELLGLKIDEAGFKKISIKPDLCGLDYVRAEIPSPEGLIKIKVDRNGVETILPAGVYFIEE